MVGKGHEGPKRPGKNVEAMEKWDQYHGDKRIKKKKQDVEMWEEIVGEAAQKKIHMKGWFQHYFPQKIKFVK